MDITMIDILYNFLRMKHYRYMENIIGEMNEHNIYWNMDDENKYHKHEIII